MRRYDSPEPDEALRVAPIALRFGRRSRNRVRGDLQRLLCLRRRDGEQSTAPRAVSETVELPREIGVMRFANHQEMCEFLTRKLSRQPSHDSIRPHVKHAPFHQ